MRAMLTRRRFLQVVSAVLLAAPLTAEAQQVTGVWRIGFLSAYSADVDRDWRVAFRDGLRDLQYVEGRNAVIEQRHAAGRLERLPDLAAELVRTGVDVCVVHGHPEAIRAAEQASRGLPIVFIANPDPVAAGLVASLGRPGGRVTGLSDAHGDLLGKRLDLLREAVPSVARVAVLHATTPLSLSMLRETQAAASAMRVTVIPVVNREPRSDVDRIFLTIRKERGDALSVLPGAAGIYQRQVAELAVKHRIPTIGTSKNGADSGFLMSYGADFAGLYRRAATYVDKILKGTKPADLPVEQPTKFELVINLKTAKALGLTIPPSLLLRADQVIE